MSKLLKQNIENALKKVIIPNYDKDIISMQRIENIIAQESYVSFTIKITPEEWNKREEWGNLCKKNIAQYIDEELYVDIQYEKIENINNEKTHNKHIKNFIAVASGKGGVGKSTVATNLAICLANKGYEVGLLDADIYGPSIPLMFGIDDVPHITTDKKLIPHYRHQVHLISMGFLVKDEDATIWRGPMVTSALRQFFSHVAWPPLDYFIIDLPPGTGDIQLTLVQNIALSGAIIVSTPQKVALNDVKKAVNMFNKVNVPILGVVENMAYYLIGSSNYTYPFGKQGAMNLSKKLNVSFLGEIPIYPEICMSGDDGIPISSPKSKYGDIKKYYQVICQRALDALSERDQYPPTQRIQIKRV